MAMKVIGIVVLVIVALAIVYAIAIAAILREVKKDFEENRKWD